ncbi:RHS repeat domain-containing protein [Streptomyces sp. NPDC020299]|uniref:RHS repeat domain-containing protein n=1 Tax=Streptomyces sp. NPDC020299 TaxID=3365067 RepID=UPI0037A2F0C2
MSRTVAAEAYARLVDEGLRTETGLSWMVDDHHGTASMTVDATTQAVTRRYTKPFGEARGATPGAWPDDKGFLGKPADADTGLTHIGAREYDPATGRFLSVDPVLAPEDHESLNGYAYANNTPVTLSDPTGLRPITDCEQGCSDGHGGGYRDWMTMGPNGTWVYHSTQTYSHSFVYQKAGGGTGSGTMTVTVRTDGGRSSARIVFKKGPDPAPVKKGSSLKTNAFGHLAGIAYSLDEVSDLANPFCWFDSDSCSASKETKETYDKWASDAGADTDSTLYEAAWDNGGMAPLLALGGKFPEENSALLPAAGTKTDIRGLGMTKTVENHTWDIAGTRDIEAPNFGKAARPYMNGNNGLLLQEIMEATAPRMDSRGAAGVVEWRSPGSMNGSNGIWELNIDTNSNKIVHFLFKSAKG